MKIDGNKKNQGKFTPRGEMSTVVSGVVRSTRVQVHAGRPFSIGTKVYRGKGE